LPSDRDGKLHAEAQNGHATILCLAPTLTRLAPHTGRQVRDDHRRFDLVAMLATGAAAARADDVAFCQERLFR
jgi:hypothetical protein